MMAETQRYGHVQKAIVNSTQGPEYKKLGSHHYMLRTSKKLNRLKNQQLF